MLLSSLPWQPWPLFVWEEIFHLCHLLPPHDGKTIFEIVFLESRKPGTWLTGPAASHSASPHSVLPADFPTHLLISSSCEGKQGRWHHPQFVGGDTGLADSLGAPPWGLSLQQHPCAHFYVEENGENQADSPSDPQVQAPLALEEPSQAFPCRVSLMSSGTPRTSPVNLEVDLCPAPPDLEEAGPWPSCHSDLSSENPSFLGLPSSKLHYLYIFLLL